MNAKLEDIKDARRVCKSIYDEIRRAKPPTIKQINLCNEYIAELYSAELYGSAALVRKALIEWERL